MNKFDDFQVKILAIDEVHQIKACIFENGQDVLGKLKLVGKEFRCTVLSDGDFKFNIGALFEDRATLITHIRFEHVNLMPSRSGKTILSNLTIVTNQQSSIFNDGGSCVDNHATRMAINSSTEPQCICEDNFVASNGGIALGKPDTCVQCLLDTTACEQCLPEPHCAFDDDPCTYNRDCSMGSCQDGTCHSEVCLLLTHLDVTVFRFRF